MSRVSDIMPELTISDFKKLCERYNVRDEELQKVIEGLSLPTFSARAVAKVKHTNNASIYESKLISLNINPTKCGNLREYILPRIPAPGSISKIQLSSLYGSCCRYNKYVSGTSPLFVASTPEFILRVNTKLYSDFRRRVRMPSESYNKYLFLDDISAQIAKIAERRKWGNKKRS